VFVLARVINIRTKPRVAFFIDPWRLHASGHMNLESLSQYEATLSSIVAQNSCVYLDQTISGNVTAALPERRQSRWYHKRKQSRTINEPQILIPELPSDSYSYRQLRLGETRLLELRPGFQDTPLSGEVHHINIEKAPPYQALSYVWGPAMQNYTLETPEGRIPIATSLYAALNRVRARDEVTYLWVDAVCINQNDGHEKSIQIRMLPKIFQSADVVLCWLGGEREDSALAIETLLQIRTLGLAPQQWPAQLPPIPANWVDGVPPVNDSVWWSIQSLFEREWFSRVWIIQEVVLAKELKFLCGNYELDWDDIIKAVEICRDDQGGPLPIECHLRLIVPSLKPVHTLGAMKSAFEDKNLSKNFNLLPLLDFFSHARSTKPCDKLFALLGIASDSTATAFDPDYSSSLEVIIRRFAREFVRRGNANELLYRAGSTKSVSFSSWIPDWTGTTVRRTISTWRGSGGIFAATAKTYLQASISSDDEGILQVTGNFVDTIIMISTLSQRGKDIIILVNDAHSIIDQLKSYPTGESLETVKLLVPIGNAVAPCEDDAENVEDIIRPSLDKDDTSLNDAFKWQDNIMKFQKVEDVVTFLNKEKVTRDKSYKYWRTASALFERLGNGRVFVTKRGYVGIAPDRTRVGDRICLVHGASVPFVIRPAKHNGFASVHSLVGETYLHGIMYGEALKFAGMSKETIYLK
jgi:hypothetical protein